MATLNGVPSAGSFAMKAGDDFAAQFTILDKKRDEGGVPRDMSDWTFSAQWRRTPSSDTAIAFDVDQSGKVDGVVIISLPPEQTRAMDSNGTFDLQGVAGDGTVKTFLTGGTVWSEDVTRSA